MYLHLKPLQDVVCFALRILPFFQGFNQISSVSFRERRTYSTSRDALEYIFLVLILLKV